MAPPRATSTSPAPLRTAIAIAAFVGAGLSAAAAAAGAPARSEDARQRWVSLRALTRRVHTLLEVDLAALSQEEARAQLDQVLDWLDEIQGAKTPRTLRAKATTTTQARGTPAQAKK